MAATIKVNIDPKTIILHRHLEKGGQAELVFATELKKLSDPYTPFDNNPLSSTAEVEAGKITYVVPYARYQWYGVSKNGNPLNYQGSPMRGKEWVLRCWEDRNRDVIKAVNDFVGGKG